MNHKFSLLDSAHPEIPDGHSKVSRSEMRIFVFASLRLPTLRVGPRFVQDQGNRGPAAKQWGLSHLEEVRRKQGLARRRTGVRCLSAVPTQAGTSKTAV
jgi:hypothetical protein